MSSSEFAASFDTIVAELDAALVRLGEPRVLDHPAFSIETSSFGPDGRCVTVEREAAASLRLMVEEPGWARVDINGWEECLVVPMPTSQSRAARERPSMQDTFVRLLTSRFTVTYGRLRTKGFMTDASGEEWCRNTYFGAKTPPRGQAAGGPRAFLAICTPANS